MNSDSPAPAEAARLLLVSDDDEVRGFFRVHLAGDHDVVLARDEQEAVARLQADAVGLVIVHHQGRGAASAFALRERLAAVAPAVPVVLMTAEGDEETAVEALHVGFVDYVVWRGDERQPDLMRRRVAGNLELARLRAENASLHEAIEESQARLFNIYDSLDDVIMQVDEDCKVVSLNRSAAALASCEPREAVGRTCHELFDFYPCEKRARKEQCHVWRTFLEGETIRGERRDPASSRVFQYMTFITTLRGRDYTVYRETDVTDKRRLEEVLGEALKSLGAGRPPSTSDRASDGGDE